jgi:hypothetical protein
MWFVYIALLLLNLLVAALKWRRLQPAFRLAALIVADALITELLKPYLPDGGKRLAEHIFIITVLLLWFSYYMLILNKQKRAWLFSGLTAFFTAVFVLWSIHPHYFYEHGYTDYIFLAICISCWSGLFFHELLYKPLQYSLSADGHFWINCGNLLFYPGNILLLGYCSYLEQANPALFNELRIINRGFNLLLYTLYLAAFLAIRRTPPALVTAEK